jgi:hypothetical protein
MSNITSIQKALDIALKQFGIDNNIIVALNNINAPTDVKIPFLASFQLNTGVESADLGHSDFRGGVYQVDINYASHKGTPPLNKMADLLNELFKAGATFTFNSVCVNIDSCEPTRIQVQNGWATMPLNINWNSYTTKL